jgi:hypothetical protein
VEDTAVLEDTAAVEDMATLEYAGIDEALAKLQASI